MTDDDFVRLFQTRAAAAGHYAGKVDGSAGTGTLLALDKVLPPLVLITAPPDPDKVAQPVSVSLSGTAEARLKGVHPKLVQLVRAAVVSSPVPFTVIEGLRTKARQEQLVKAGASKTMNSRHLTGHAVDLWPLDPATGKPLPAGTKAREAALWAGLRQISAAMKIAARDLGIAIEWGGDWGWDAPHFQLNRAAYPA